MGEPGPANFFFRCVGGWAGGLGEGSHIQQGVWRQVTDLLGIARDGDSRRLGNLAEEMAETRSLPDGGRLACLVLGRPPLLWGVPVLTRCGPAGFIAA